MGEDIKLFFEVLKARLRIAFEPKNLGGFYPLQPWLRRTLEKKHPSQRLQFYSRLVKGTDLSFVAPDEYGCQESVSRICQTLFGDPVYTYTRYALDQEYIGSQRWIEVSYPINGCVVIAASPGNKQVPNGHVGIYDNGKLWNNNSATGTWQRNYTIPAFIDRYERRGGMKVRYFIRTFKGLR